MSTRHLVDPELLAALDSFPDFDLTDRNLHMLREGMSGFLPPEESYAHPDILIERREAPGVEGAPSVPILLYRPKGGSRPLPVLLHIHGGGYVLGRAEQNGPGNVRTALEVGCLVASVEYRLAPDTPAPGALLDCYAVLRWLHDNAAGLALDTKRIAVGGESAGGGLAAALALFARDRGEFGICFQMLICPMIDDRTSAFGSGNPHVGEFVWTRAANAFGWRSYIGAEPGGEGVSAYAAPARAVDLAGLPPAYISTGALDLFLDENVDYAQRLMRAGVPAELHVFPGAYHGFELAADARISRTAESERRQALARAFEGAVGGKS